MPAAVSRLLRFSDLSTERVPISTGRSAACSCLTLSDDGVELRILGRKDAVGQVLADARAIGRHAHHPQLVDAEAVSQKFWAAVPVMPDSFLYSRKYD